MTNSNPGTPWGPTLPTGSKRTVEEKDLPAPSTRTRGFARPVETIDTSPPIADNIKTTTCYMCACRCGIRVHLKDGRIRYIEGNRDHPVNKGVLCGKGSAGIMKHYSPARLSKPLLRVGERGSGEFKEIEWDEAIGPRDRLARRDPPHRSAQAGLLHRPRPEPVADRLVGASSSARRTSPRMAASARSTWRRPGSTASAAPSGNSVSRTGSTRIFHDVRRRRGPRFQPDQDRHRASSRRAAPSSSRSTRSDRLFRDRRRMDRHPAGDRRPVRLSLMHELLKADGSISTISPATPTRPGWWCESRRRR